MGVGGRRGNAARSLEAPLELCRRAKVRHIIAVKAQWYRRSRALARKLLGALWDVIASHGCPLHAVSAMNTLWARGKITRHVMHGHSARAQSCTPVTRRGSSVETPWSPSGHYDVFFTEILRRFQKFHNALITLWERYLE